MPSRRIQRFLVLVFSYFVLSSFVFTEDTRAGDNVWTSIGLYGAVVEALAIDPNNPAILYAGVNWAGIYKTVDGGSTWTNISAGLPTLEFDDIAVDPNNSNIVYASIHQGPLYKSIDGGNSWRQSSSINNFSVAVHPLESNILLIGGWNGGIFRSVDGGNSWQESTGASQAWLGARVIVFAPGAPHIVYSAGFDGVWKSMDGGINWTAINSGFAVSPEVWSLAIDPYDNQVIYIGTALDGIYKSTNGGGSWFPIGTGLNSSHITAVVINPANQQNMYVGGGINPGTGTPGIYKSLDNQGLSWEPMMDGMSSRAIYRLVIDNSVPRNIYAGTYGGIWKYTLASTIEDYSISIDNGAIFTNQTAVTLTLTAPPGTSEVIISNDGGFTDSNWELFVHQKPWTITSYGDNAIPRTVYAKFKTNGKISSQYQDDIVLDTTAPSGSIEVVNNPIGEIGVNALLSSITYSKFLTNTIFLPSTLNNTRLGYNLVDLLLSATDDLSGVSHILISNNSDFQDAEWLPYVSKTKWWVPINVSTKVYVIFRDRAGNLSPVYSDSVER
jgi:hypothetical protein